jgi:hypothetical protein
MVVGNWEQRKAQKKNAKNKRHMKNKIAKVSRKRNR